MITATLCLMILCHIIDDFVLQNVLAKLKQKDWWTAQPEYNELYKDDYKMALFIHSLEWSIMINLPLIFLFGFGGLGLFISVAINTAIHYFVDDAKANKKTINLVLDQEIHFCQVFLTLLVFMVVSFLTDFETWVQ